MVIEIDMNFMYTSIIKDPGTVVHRSMESSKFSVLEHKY
jgi:hypothetical protein